MLCESEVKHRIGRDIPALSVELSYIKDRNDVYSVIECLTKYTKALIHEDRINEVGQCFRAAYELMHEGNRLIQLAVENIFIDSIGHLLEFPLTAARPVRQVFLENFEEQYYKQL